MIEIILVLGIGYCLAGSIGLLLAAILEAILWVGNIVWDIHQKQP